MESPTTKTTRPSHPPKPAKAVSGGSNGLFPRAVSQPVATATQNSPIPRLSTAPPNHAPSRGTGPLCQSPGRIRTRPAFLTHTDAHLGSVTAPATTSCCWGLAFAHGAMALAPTQLTAPCVATPAWNSHDGEVADRHVCWLQQKGLEAAGQGSGRGGTRGMSRSRGRQSRGTEIGRMHEDMVTAAAARRHGHHHGTSGPARAVETGRQQHWADCGRRTGQRARRRGSAGCAVRIAANSRIAPGHPMRQLHEPGMM